MNTRNVLIMILFAIAWLGGCSDGAEPSGSLQFSPQVLGTPPVVVETGRFGGSYYSIGQIDPEATPEASNTSGVEFIDLDGEELLISPPGNEVLYAATWSVQDDSYLVVGTVDSSDRFRLYRYEEDEDGNFPDPLSETLLLDTGTNGAYITDIARDADGNAYLLDRRCQDIWLARDTDDDGWPDTLATSLFARSVDYPALAAALIIEVKGVGKIEAMRGRVSGRIEAYSHGTGTLFEDEDGDGIADTQTTRSPWSLRPYVYGVPYDGQTSMRLYTKVYTQGLTAEIWLLDEDGEDVAQLGSGSFTAAGSDEAIDITLSPPLVEGAHIGIRHNGQEETQLITIVGAAIPKILGSDPAVIFEGEATTVTLYGYNLTSSMTLRYQDVEDGVTYLTFTLVSSTEISVEIPAITKQAQDQNWIKLWGEEDEQEGGAVVMGMPVCPAPE